VAAWNVPSSESRTYFLAVFPPTGKVLETNLAFTSSLLEKLSVFLGQGGGRVDFLLSPSFFTASFGKDASKPRFRSLLGVGYHRCDCSLFLAAAGGGGGGGGGGGEGNVGLASSGAQRKGWSVTQPAPR